MLNGHATADERLYARTWWVLLLAGCAAAQDVEEEHADLDQAATTCSMYTDGEEYKASLALAWIARAAEGVSLGAPFVLDPTTQVAKFARPCPTGSAAATYYVPFGDARIEALARVQCAGGQLALGRFTSERRTVKQASAFRHNRCQHLQARFDFLDMAPSSSGDSTSISGLSTMGTSIEGAAEALLSAFGGTANRRLYKGSILTIEQTNGTSGVTYSMKLDPLGAPAAPSGSTVSNTAYITSSYTFWSRR